MGFLWGLNFYPTDFHLSLYYDRNPCRIIKVHERKKYQAPKGKGDQGNQKNELALEMGPTTP